jgi:hypothetical protein
MARGRPREEGRWVADVGRRKTGRKSQGLAYLQGYLTTVSDADDSDLDGELGLVW